MAQIANLEEHRVRRFYRERILPVLQSDMSIGCAQSVLSREFTSCPGMYQKVIDYLARDQSDEAQFYYLFLKHLPSQPTTSILSADQF